MLELMRAMKKEKEMARTRDDLRCAARITARHFLGPYTPFVPRLLLRTLISLSGRPTIHP